MSGTFARWVGLKDGEGPRTARLFAFIFLLTSAAVFARSAQREIFLAAFPRSAISDGFLYSSGLLVVLSVALSAAATRLTLVRLMDTLLLVASAAMIGGFFALGLWPKPAAMGIYVGVEAFVSLLIAQGWAIAGEAVDLRAAKRLLPVIGLGAGLAWTVGGAAVGAFAHLVGPGVLLWVAPLTLLGAFFMLRVLVKLDLPQEPRRAEAAPHGVFASLLDGLRYIATEPLTRVLAAAITIELVVEKITDLQLFAASQEHFAGQTGGIAAFMGLFYAVTGAVTLVAPFVSGRVLSSIGSTRAMLVVPIWVLVGSFAFLALPQFWVVVLLTGGDRILKQALGGPARSQVLGALPTVRRVQAGALLRGVLAAAFSALAAGGLKALPADLPVEMLSVGSVVLMLGLALVTQRFLHQSYLIALQRSVDRTRLDLDAVREEQNFDREQLATLREELANPDPVRATLAIALVGNAELRQGRPLLVQALAHPAAEVRALAAATLAKKGDASDVPALVKTLEQSQEPEVVTACLKGLVELAAVQAMAAVSARCDAADPRVRALARVARLRLLEQQGDAASARAELEAFEAMLTAPRASERAAAAWAMGQVPPTDPRIKERFAPLLADAEAEVRHAAIGASGNFPDEPIVRALVFALEEPGTAQVAYDAFVQLGDEGVDQVEQVLEGAPVAIVSRTATALSRGGGARATDLLKALLVHADPQVRFRAARALVTRRRASEEWRPPGEKQLLDAIQKELHQGYRYHAALAAVRQDLQADDPESRFVAGELDSRIQETERRLLALVAVVADPRIARLSHHLRDASPQVTARVLELVEESLDTRLSAVVVPFLERQDAAQKARIGTAQYAVPAQFANDPIVALLELGDEHLRRVARVAFKKRVSERFPDLASKEDPLLQMVERLRFLRSVPVFKDLNPEDLMKLAEIASPSQHPSGKFIFRKGDPGDVMCVVVRGRVQIRDGGQVIATQGPNDFFGELALFDQEPRSADAVCAEDTELLEIGGADLESLMERRPEIAREIIRVLARRLRVTTQQLVRSSLGPKT